MQSNLQIRSTLDILVSTEEVIYLFLKKMLLIILLINILTTVFLPFSPHSSSPTMFSLSTPTTPIPSLFRKGQASLGYQPNKDYQIAIRLGTSPFWTRNRGMRNRTPQTSKRVKVSPCSKC